MLLLDHLYTCLMNRAKIKASKTDHFEIQTNLYVYIGDYIFRP